MTNSPSEPDRLRLRFDPEGLLPGMPELPPLPELESPAHHCITITDLTPEQFESIQAGIVQAMAAEKPSRTGKFVGKVVLVGLTMVFLAACIWAVAQILTPLTNR